ncbi:MAG TPA: hypothetical protein VMS01_04965 [Stellaceae bacterium]|nr:hypothetical protein [Stellaceae bacterium]
MKAATTIDIHRVTKLRTHVGDSSRRVQRLTGFAVVVLASLALWTAIVGGLVAIWR